MGQLGSKLRRIGPSDGYTATGLAHWCPACKEMHAFALDGKNASGAQWSWDGNVEAPTFTPSMHIKTNPPGDPHYQPQACSSVCHYILTAGILNFCGDSTHELAGKSVPLPPLPEGYTDE